MQQLGCSTYLHRLDLRAKVVYLTGAQRWATDLSATVLQDCLALVH